MGSLTVNENFECQYKYILKKSNEALILESKGHKSEAYSLFKSIVSDIDNIINGAKSKDLNTSDKLTISKSKNLKSLRNNICDCIDRMQQQNVSNEDLLVAELIYSIQSECQYTKISKNDMSSIPCYPSSLEIYKFPSTSKGNRGFIMVSDWLGALIQDVTPILITPEGALIFFDTENDQDIKVAVTLPYDVTKEEFERCVSVLARLAVVVYDGEQIQIEDYFPTDKNVRKSTGEVIAKGINTVSHSLSKGVVLGANKLGELVCKGSNELCQHISPGQSTMNPNVKLGLEYARTGSHAMIQVSGMALGVLSRATQYLASKTAPHILKAANNVIPDEWKEKGKDGEISKVEQVALVTGTSLQGLVLLLDSLHDGAITFGRCAARSSGQVMSHRYGEEVGQSTENALYAAGNLGMVVMVAKQFTRRGILKSAAAVTALEVSQRYRGADNVSPDSVKNNTKHI